MPGVSVVVPAYNPGTFLELTLRSVIDQSFSDWETVVVDDGSTEDLSWVDGLHPGIRRVRQENRGLSAARNRGIAESDSGLVAFLDADDLWLPDKLTRQVETMADSAISLTSTGFTIVDADGKYLSAGFSGFADSYERLLQGNGICASTVVVRRSVLDECGPFDTSLPQCEDWDMWLRVARGRVVHKIETVLAHYRQHAHNMSRKYMVLRRSSRDVLHRQIDVARSVGSDEHVRLARIGLRRLDQLIATHAFDAGRDLYRSQPISASAHFARAARLDPAFVAERLGAEIRSRVSRLIKDRE